MQSGSQKVSRFAFAASLAVLSIIAATLSNQEAFGDGLTSETFSATLGDRNAELLVQVNPPILTDASRNDAYILFRLYDANNNQTIQYTTFFISVEKGVGQDAETIMPPTLFHTESGLLRLKVQPTEGELQIFGTQEQFLNAWVADPGGTVNIQGPLFLEGGLYHLRVEIFGVDNIRNIFADENIPKFDSWLSVGDVFTQSIDYQGQSYDTTIISYYDRVRNFSFDGNNQQFTWSMPFDWNVSRIEDTNIFVHEEIRIPKSLPGIGNTSSFTATVNGNPISGRMITVDPYSSQQDLTLHYLINKNDILRMVGDIPPGISDMVFTLAPSGGQAAQSTGEIVTETGNVMVLLEWAPDQLNANTESTLTLNFYDGFSGERIQDNVNYNLRILDNNGTQIYSETALVAEGGTGTHTIDFPADENYRMEVEVTGIARDGQSLDQTRNGIARGVVVVPEFPTGSIVAAAAVTSIMGGVIIVLRRLVKIESGLGRK
ncbi:MAG: hypothetical protein M3382_05405 [Thermoproteota archaeon]|nr:hypothetical protein [Thermoproteota archaeon]